MKKILCFALSTLLTLGLCTMSVTKADDVSSLPPAAKPIISEFLRSKHKFPFNSAEELSGLLKSKDFDISVEKCKELINDYCKWYNEKSKREKRQQKAIARAAKRQRT